MQSYQILTLGWTIVSYIIYVIVTQVITSRRRAAKARELKCIDPPWFKNRLPLGIDQVQRALKADRAAKFPDLVFQRAYDVAESAGLDKPVWTWKYSLLGATGINTFEPENVKFILAKGFEDFDLGPIRRGNFFPLLGNGIFTADGKGWEHSRAMMRPQFARDQVSDLDLEERHVQNMMQALTVNSDGWTDEIDIQVLFFRLTLDSATEFLFGESVDSQLNELPNQAQRPLGKRSELEFASAFDKSQMTLSTRARFGEKYWLYNPKDFKEACLSCHEFIDHFVRLALSKQLHKTYQEKADGKYVFLEALASTTQDPIELRSQLLNILLAGRDTTASLLSWLFLLLSRNPTYYTKLRTTILADFGPYTSDPTKTITFSTLKSCTFLQHCISETLRLYPVVPINSRRANKDTHLPTGGGPDGKSPIFVQEGQAVDYSVWVMHRRKDIWGDDAEVFRPERWEGRKSGWEYLPFNGGPRICIGQQFAVTEASYVAVRFMQRFEECVVGEGVGEVRYGLTLTMCPKDGVRVRLREGVDGNGV